MHPPKIPKGICSHPPEYFPGRSATSAAEGRAGPGFPPGSGRSPPSSAAGIPHPLWSQAPGRRQHPAPWGEEGRGEHPTSTCWGAGSLAGLQDPTWTKWIPRTGSLLGGGRSWDGPSHPTHLLLLQTRTRSSPGLSAGIFHSQAARNPQTLRTSQPRNLQGTHGDILAGEAFPPGSQPPQPASLPHSGHFSSPFHSWKC